jgi:hemerythrin-like domain-containing protein
VGTLAMPGSSVRTINYQNINVVAPCTTYEREENILNRLLVEHDHILRTLNLLEMQFLDLCRGKTPDFSLMRSIIVYIQEYPEQIHHPLEDMIFSILLERVDETKFIEELITEHTQLEVIARKLRESLEALNSSIVSREDVKQQLSSFLVGQRQHIYIEEVEAYPLVHSVLTKKDWKQLNYMIPLLDDPAFGRRTQNDYECLYREIKDKSKLEII